MIKPTKLFFLLVITLFSILLLTSCKSEPAKIDKLCTLTLEQFPEIRGFRIGMTLEQILQKYPTLCKFDATIRDANFIIRTSGLSLPIQDDEYSPTTIDYGIHPCSTQTRMLSPNEYPDLNGIYKIELTIKENRLTNLKVKYGETKDMQFFNNFAQKVKETLGLTEWSNWQVSENPRWKLIGNQSYRIESKFNNLQCNKLIVSIVTEESTIPSAMPLVGYTYTTYLQVSENSEVAMTENQRQAFEKQQQNQAQAERQKQLEEERKKGENFKP